MPALNFTFRDVCVGGSQLVLQKIFLIWFRKGIFFELNLLYFVLFVTRCLQGARRCQFLQDLCLLKLYQFCKQFFDLVVQLKLGRILMGFWQQQMEYLLKYIVQILQQNIMDLNRVCLNNCLSGCEVDTNNAFLDFGDNIVVFWMKWYDIIVVFWTKYIDKLIVKSCFLKVINLFVYTGCFGVFNEIVYV
eukprot:TRINITY_DN7999_c2_g1_i1.p2 TRINITY_DN7999_c2_g1~~TRINITY_DN7999_c2_g1_i1.p2  ORF type:complete len:190 (+),score=0.50 TRINITY_DN7999_c2_g1_i1:502-1071(+)